MPQDRSPAPHPPPSSAFRGRPDPLYTVLTLPGPGAIATYLIDGEGALEHVARCFRTRKSPAALRPGRPRLGRLVDARDQTVDEAIVTLIPAQESETGRPQVELSCHGGSGSAAAAAQALEDAGIRRGEPFELSQRSHLAGRLPLPTLEARLRLAQALTERQTRLLLSQDAFRERWERLGLQAGLGLRSGSTQWREELHRAAQADLAALEGSLRLLRSHRVTLVGPANAGKSTLVNRLLRAERSIVNDRAGTTRDCLEHPAVLRGLILRLYDTAGLRALPEGTEQAQIEREGQARAWEAAGAADLLLIVLDASRAPSPEELELAVRLRSAGPGPEPVPHLLVLNQSDRGIHLEARALAAPAARGFSALEISALSGTGLTRLEEALEEALLGSSSAVPGPAPFTLRQGRHLKALQSGLEEGLDGTDLIGHIRNLIGTRPNVDELEAVWREASVRQAHAL